MKVTTKCSIFNENKWCHLSFDCAYMKRYSNDLNGFLAFKPQTKIC